MYLKKMCAKCQFVGMVPLHFVIIPVTVNSSHCDFYLCRLCFAKPIFDDG